MTQLQMTRTQMRWFLLVLLGVDAIMIGAIMGVVISPRMGLVGFALGGVLPIAVFRGLIPLIAGAVGWWSLQRIYPPTGTASFDAKTPLTSMSIRSPMLGMNNCIEVAQDDDHLHLRIFGLIGPPIMPISIPWAAMTSITVSRRGVAAVILDQGPKLWFPGKLLAREIELRAQLDAPGSAETAGIP